MIQIILNILICLKIVSAQIRVISPIALKKEFGPDGLLRTPDGIIQGSTSTFGAPTYGQTLFARLIRFNPDASQYCDGSVSYGDENFAMETIKRSNSDYSNAFIIDRGGCSFVEKVIEAEKYGADIVIFVDDIDSEWSRYSLRNVILSNNGHGTKVNIPSMMITYEDGQEMIRYAQKPDNYRSKVPAVVQFNWEMPQNDTVVFDFWMSSSFEEASLFISEFSPLAVELQNQLEVHPHFYVVGLNDLPATDRKVMCYNEDSNYCVYSNEEGLTGTNILHEDVRQLCILDSGSKSTVQKEHLWMEYISLMRKECPLGSDFSCGDTVIKHLGGSNLQSAINKCMADIDKVKEMLMREKNSKAWAPLAMRINEARFNGNLDPILVMKSICTGFRREMRPDACDKYFEPSLSSVIVKGRFTLFNSLWYFMVICVVLLALKLWRDRESEILRRSLRSEVMAEVRNHLSSYQMAEDYTDTTGSVSNIELGNYHSKNV